VPTVIIIWGTIAGCVSHAVVNDISETPANHIQQCQCAAAQNFAGLLVLRLLLGIFESAYAPGLAYFFSLWYERKEMARRLGYYVSIAPLAASFAGAFAYFVTLHPHSIAGWRALFLVEGLPSVGVGKFRDAQMCSISACSPDRL
jgi:MFS family permease